MGNENKTARMIQLAGSEVVLMMSFHLFGTHKPTNPIRGRIRLARVAVDKSLLIPPN